jgi:hypothetical protein
MPGRDRVPSLQLAKGTTNERDLSYDLTDVGSIFYNTDTSNVEIRHEDPTNSLAWRDLVVNNKEQIDISGKLVVKDDISANGQLFWSHGQGYLGGVPIGCILMWSGTLTTIPTYWQLCDGTNGTPNLKDRFIVGAGDGYNAGDTGGSVSKTLTTDHLPYHNHTTDQQNTTSAGAHSHNIRFAKIDDRNFTGTGNPSGQQPGVVSDAGSYTTPYQSNYTHSSYPIIESAVSHNHTINASTSNYTGNNNASLNILPPFYALCYIMYKGYS